MSQAKTMIIDCQVFQTDALHRGMGKYSMSLLKELPQPVLPHQEVVLLFNKNIAIEPEVLNELSVIYPNAQEVQLELLIPGSRRRNADIASYNKKVLNSFIEKLGLEQPVDFLILSLFLSQAFIVFPDNARKLLVFYDLIPYLFESRYKERINYDDYLIHFKTIFEADLIYTISQTIADDMTVYLGIPANKLHNIDGASIDRSHFKSKKPSYNIPGKFILMPTGDELRKNNLNAIKGFSEFNEQHNNAYSLVITSTFGDVSKQELEIYSDKLIFSGNIPGAQLQYLYENADFIFFPSEYEGLGLPILEAMSVNKKIACSNIPVFREISEDALYFFDPTDPSAIAQGLAAALQGHDWSEMKAQYKAIIKHYTWKRTAEEFLAGHSQLQDVPKVTTNKPRVAVFTPHPSGYSAIGKVVAECHATFSEKFDVDYYFDYTESTTAHVRPDFLSYVANCYDAADFTAHTYEKYDAVVYHIGNSDYHLNTIRNALYLPGYAVLHDTHLQGAFGELKRYGIITDQRMELEELLDKKNKHDTSTFLASLVNNQRGIIAHSQYAAKAVQSILAKDVPVSVVNLPTATPVRSHQLRDDKGMQIGLAGILAEVKGLPLIEQLATHPEFQQHTFNIFGFSFIKPETLEKLSYLDNVRIFKDPSDFEFQTRLSQLDMLINYRSEYRGETSLTVLEAMRYGALPFVRDTGWYSELPSDTVIQVSREEELASRLHELTDNVKLLQTRQVASKKYVGENFTHQQYAAGIAELLLSTEQ
jgi:glycosyltransferase involved in cell wall biosynthesis